MEQATLDDDDLFGEAASELRADVEEHIEAAWAALPKAEEIWAVQADNVLGVLNTLRSGLEATDAREHARAAKKWYTVGERAGAFEEEPELSQEIETLEQTIEEIESIRSSTGELASTLPRLREALNDRTDRAVVEATE